MDAGKPVVDRPLVRRHLEREEMPAGHRVGLGPTWRHPLAEVQEETTILLLQPGQERARVLGVHVGDAPLRLEQIRIVGLLDVAHDPAVEALYSGVAAEHDPLARRHTPEQALALDIADQRRQQRGLALRVPVLTHDRHRTADELAVVGVVRPLAAVLEQLWHRAPQRQRVVAEVVVQLDQAWEERAAGIHRSNVVEAGGRRLARSCTATMEPRSM